MVCEEEDRVLCTVVFDFPNPLINACEIVGRLGNEQVRERSMSRLENDAYIVYISLTPSPQSHKRKDLQGLITSDPETSLQ